MDYYMIRGPYCGHDKTGAFHCECGKCELLRSDVSIDAELVYEVVIKTYHRESTCDNSQ